jgi:hypothetical protein
LTSRSELKEYLMIQIEEIRKHKWIESEKAGCDLGQDAVRDWIKRNAAKFRAEFYEDRQTTSS